MVESGSPSGGPAATPPAGWFKDPDSPGQLRWWDGAAWTDHRHNPSNSQLNESTIAKPAGAEQRSAMIVATMSHVAGQRIIETKGQVFGVVVFVPELKQISHSLGRIVGEYEKWTHAVKAMRLQAIDRMIQDALAMGANGILSMRFDSASLTSVGEEIVAYGTAVVLAPDSSTAAPAS